MRPWCRAFPRTRAITKDDGTFTVTTFAEGDGAAEGGYQVVLVWPGETDEAAEGEAEQETDRLKGWYDVKHSTLSVRVNPGDNSIPTFNLAKITQPPPASQGIPGRN